MRKAKKRTLLATMTKEPFQPVRLYYSIPSPVFVVKKLRALQCMVEVPAERCWQWLFDAEAVSLRFQGGYDDVPKEKRPIVLARLCFPANNGMTLQTNSFERAIGAARFLAPRLGKEVVAMRCRVVNRLFAAEEGLPAELMRSLDQNVTVIDARLAEAAYERDFAGVRTIQDFERTAAERIKRVLERKDDVPVVEDFPLAPEEETSDFGHLSMTLRLRAARAIEHWRGNTDLTLTAIIMRTVEQGWRAGESSEDPAPAPHDPTA